MSSTFRLVRFTVCSLAAFAFSSCATMGVSSYIETGADIARYQTYGWASAGTLSTGDPRLDNNPFFHERLQTDVERQLAARGFEKTAAAPISTFDGEARTSSRSDVQEES